MRRSRWLTLGGVIACGPTVPIDPGGTTGSGESESTRGSGGEADSSVTFATSDPTSADSSGAVTTIGTSSGGGETSTAESNDDGVGFIDGDGGGGTAIECDIWIDECPPGEKCMPWANDGGNSWNATKCAPLADAPNDVGEPCTVEGSGVSGLDDCEAHSMCWDVDWETNTGTCVAFCSGSEANPTCGDPCTPCSISNEGVLILCLAVCDPLAQECPEGRFCGPTYDGSFTCLFDVGKMGALGDGCEFLNVCDPGLFCAPAEQLPACAAQGCCSAFCDVSAADPCPDLIAGTECIPWYDEGEAPPCFAHVIGGCLLPE